MFFLAVLTLTVLALTLAGGATASEPAPGGLPPDMMFGAAAAGIAASRPWAMAKAALGALRRQASAWSPGRFSRAQRLSAGALALLVVAPLLLAAIRYREPAFAPLILVMALLSFAFFLWFRPAVRGSAVAAYLAILYLLAAPGVVARADLSYFVFYYAAVSALFVVVLSYCRSAALARLSLVPVCLPSILVAVVFAAYAADVGVRLDQGSLFAIYQTDPDEAAGYLSEFVRPWTAAALLAALCLIVLLLVRVRPFERRPGARLNAGALAAAAVAIGLSYPASNEFRVISSLDEYRHVLLHYQKVAKQRKTDFAAIAARQTRPDAATHVIVVGESTNRNHMGIYGYFRDTTPNLAARADQLVTFTDVIANHSHTVPVLSHALTLADVGSPLTYASGEAYSIIEILKAAGVRTYWLSNQNRLGVFGNHVAVLAESADEVRFLPRDLGDRRLVPVDEALLPAFREALRDDAGPKVIFLHLMGTHAPYAIRHPRGFGQFTGPLPPSAIGARRFGVASAKHVNSYDNAVLYLDHVLSEVIGILEEEGPPVSSLLFFSDHGESPMEGTGHNADQFSPGHVEIPFLFWFSDAFKDQYGPELTVLKGNRHRPFMIDDLEDVLMDLVGIATEHLEPERSLFRAGYVETARKTLNGQIDYDRYRHPRLNATRNLQEIRAANPRLYEKVWAHRVNSLGKLSEAMRIFSGVELDLVFNGERNVFEVRHPPVEDTGLTLEGVLEYLRRQGAPIRLWLDVKNVGQDNLEPLIDQLLRLDMEYDLKDRVIVETIFRGPGVDRLAAAGFYVSYYLPTKKIRTALDQEDREQMQRLAEEVVAVVERHQARAISFNINLYPFVEAYLGEHAAAQGLDFLTWDLSLSSSDVAFSKLILERKLDPRLQVVLVPFGSKFGI